MYDIIIRFNEKADVKTIQFIGVKVNNMDAVTTFANAAIRQLGLLDETVKIDAIKTA